MKLLKRPEFWIILIYVTVVIPLMYYSNDWDAIHQRIVIEELERR